MSSENKTERDRGKEKKNFPFALSPFTLIISIESKKKATKKDQDISFCYSTISFSLNLLILLTRVSFFFY